MCCLGFRKVVNFVRKKLGPEKFVWNFLGKNSTYHLPESFPESKWGNMALRKEFRGRKPKEREMANNKISLFFKSLLLGIFISGFGVNGHAETLPAGYTELEYIESTGTQYIDTGYIMTSDVVEYGISLVGKNSVISTSLFGSETNTNPKYSGVIFGSLLYIGGSGAIAPFTWADDKNDIVVKTTSATSGTLTHNGVENSFTYTGGVQKTESIALFGNKKGEIIQLSSIKVKHFYIKDNGTLVRNLIPAKRNSDSVVGMYDTVSGTFFTNAGTGSFIAGPAVLNSCLNLFDKTITANLMDGYVVNATVGSITTYNSFNGGDKCIRMPVKPNTAYTVIRKTGISGVYDRIRIASATSPTATDNLTVIINMSGDTTTPSATFTTLADTNNIIINVRNSGAVGDDWQQYLDNFMLVEGTTAPTSYIPYDASCHATCPNGGTLQTYTSATGTVTQNGTPTPANPITPTFYTQGNMILRKVGDVADSYDATTGKITRRVGVAVLDGTEHWAYGGDSTGYGFYHEILDCKTDGKATTDIICTNLPTRTQPGGYSQNPSIGYFSATNNNITVRYDEMLDGANVTKWQSYLAAQYAAGTPVTVYYPLATPVEEDWAAEQCSFPIKIATTAYNAARFSPVVTELNNTIATIRSVVTNTINQTKAIADLQTTKQTRPDEQCPAGKKCLLVEDNDGQPHWYEIIEKYSRLPDGFTELESITFPVGTYIKTGITPKTFDYEVGFKGAISRTTGGPNCAWGFMSGSTGLVPRWICATYQDGYVLNANTTLKFGTSDADTHTFVGRVYEKNGNYYWSSELDGAIEQNDKPINSTADWEANTLEIYLGARNKNGLAADYGLITANRWWCKKAGVMIADYIPAKRNSDNVLGMYDTVSGTFFTNAGTDEFIAGPVAQ